MSGSFTCHQSKGRTVARRVAAIGIVLIVGCLFHFRWELLENWYLYRLTSKSEETRTSAARALGKMRSRRAVRMLVRQYRAGIADSRETAAPACAALNQLYLTMTGEEWVRFRGYDVTDIVGYWNVPDISLDTDLVLPPCPPVPVDEDALRSMALAAGRAVWELDSGVNLEGDQVRLNVYAGTLWVLAPVPVHRSIERLLERTRQKYGLTLKSVVRGAASLASRR